MPFDFFKSTLSFEHDNKLGYFWEISERNGNESSLSKKQVIDEDEHELKFLGLYIKTKKENFENKLIDQFNRLIISSNFDIDLLTKIIKPRSLKWKFRTSLNFDSGTLESSLEEPNSLNKIGNNDEYANYYLGNARLKSFKIKPLSSSTNRPFDKALISITDGLSTLSSIYNELERKNNEFNSKALSLEESLSQLQQNYKKVTAANKNLVFNLNKFETDESGDYIKAKQSMKKLNSILKIDFTLKSFLLHLRELTRSINNSDSTRESITRQIEQINHLESIFENERYEEFNDLFKETYTEQLDQVFCDWIINIPAVNLTNCERFSDIKRLGSQLELELIIPQRGENFFSKLHTVVEDRRDPHIRRGEIIETKTLGIKSDQEILYKAKVVIGK